MVLIPERPFDIDDVCDRIIRRHERGRYASIVVVAEGAEPKAGHARARRPKVVRPVRPRAPRRDRQPRIAEAIGDRTGFDTRPVLLGHVQRGGTPTAYDRVLSTRFGVGAIDAVHDRAWGKMIVLRGDHIDTTPLTDAVGKHPPGRPVAVRGRRRAVLRAERLPAAFADRDSDGYARLRRLRPSPGSRRASAGPSVSSPSPFGHSDRSPLTVICTASTPSISRPV